MESEMTREEIDHRMKELVCKYVETHDKEIIKELHQLSRQVWGYRITLSPYIVSSLGQFVTDWASEPWPRFLVRRLFLHLLKLAGQSRQPVNHANTTLG